MTTYILIDDQHIDEYAGFIDFPVRLSEPSSARVTVEYANADGTADRFEDYANILGRLSFEPGETLKTLRIPILNDTQVEPLQAFRFTLASPQNASLSRTSSTIFIHDNDRLPGTPFISVRDVTVDESLGVARFVVALDKPGAAETDVTFTTEPINAEPGEDYVPTSGTLRFAPGQVVGSVSVPLIDDNRREGDEAFELRLVSTNGAVITDRAATAVIVDNDTPAVQRPVVQVLGAEVGERDGYAELVVRLSGPSSLPVSLNLTTSNLWQHSNSGTDYAGQQSHSAVLPPGQTSLMLPFILLDDAVTEPLESILVNTTVPSDITLGTIEALAFIHDDDADVVVPALQVHDLWLDERDGFARFVIALDQTTSNTVTLDWATEAGTAVPGVDFVAQTGRLVFAPGQQVQTILIPLLDDGERELDEFFTIALSAPTQATLPVPVIHGVIAANDAPALARPLATPRVATIGEGDGWVEVAVTLEAPSLETATLRYAGAGLTAGNADHHGVGTVNTFNITLAYEPGRTVRTLRIPVVDDALAEPTEALQTTLDYPVNLAFSSDRELAAIRDDDAAPGVPNVSVDQLALEESSGFARFEVTLDRPSTDIVYVTYGTRSSSAISDADFTPVAGTLTFAPGEVRRSVLVPITNDAAPEPAETLNLLLLGTSPGVLADPTGAATISRNDLPVIAKPNVAVDTVRVTEGEPWMDVVIRLDRPASTPITITYSTTNVTATSPSDFRAASGPVSFAAGETVAHVRLALVDDRVAEAAELLQFNLVPNAAVNLLSPNTLMTIVDDDAAGGQFVFGPSQIDRREGSGESTFTVEVLRLGNRGAQASVDWTVVAGTAGTGDFVGSSLPNGRLVFAPGQASQRIEFGVAGDTRLEAHEGFTVTLANPTGATVATASLAGRLQNDDPVPRSAPPALGRDANFLFDPVHYLWRYPDIAAAIPIEEASAHYLRDGAAQGRAPNAWFDATWYAQRWPDLTPLNLDAGTLFQHFNLYGVWEGRAPGPQFANFDGNRYLADNPDVAAYVDANVADFLGSRSNGAIAHYLIYGAAEQRLTYDTAGQPVVLEYWWL